jgi:hypothetical protein
MRKAMEVISGIVRLPLQIARIIGFFMELLYASACFFVIDRQIEKHASSEAHTRQRKEKPEEEKVERHEPRERCSEDHHDMGQQADKRSSPVHAPPE